MIFRKGTLIFSYHHLLFLFILALFKPNPESFKIQGAALPPVPIPPDFRSNINDKDNESQVSS